MSTPSGDDAGSPGGTTPSAAVIPESINVGMVFATQKAATHAVQDLALSQGKRAVIDGKRSGGKSIIYKCSSKTQCSFEVRMLKSRANDVKGLFVSSCTLEHHGCPGYKKPTQRQVAGLSTTVHAVTANSKATARSLVNQIQASSQLIVPQRMMYRARDAILDGSSGDYERTFKKVGGFLAAFCEVNPTSHFKIECDAEGRFDRAFLSHPYVARHEVHGQRILGIDGTFMKHKMYKEVMLVLVGRDGDNHNITLAVALVKAEDSRNCVWFIENCRVAGVTFQGVPTFSDRGRGLYAALQGTDLGAVARYCTCHIIGNILSKFSGSSPPPPELKVLVYRIQAAETEEEFKAILFTLAITHPNIAKYIEAIDPCLWAMHPESVRSVKMYGWRTTNFVESTNGAALEARFLFPFDFFKYYANEFMTKAYESQQSYTRWASEGRTLTPFADKIVREQQDLIANYTVRPKNLTVAFVNSLLGMQVQHRVDVGAGTCTCSFMRQMGLPCRHLIATLVKFECLDRLYNYCDSCYRVESYSLGYACGEDGGIELVLDSRIRANMVDSVQPLPPIRTLTSSGRVKTKRIPSQGEREDAAGEKGQKHCSLCGQPGHNRRTCPEG